MSLRAHLELVRLPAVFTAPSDVLAGSALAAVAGHPGSWAAVGILVAASAAIYCAGMAANDLCDLEIDRRERPLRPLPSGRVSIRSTWALVLGLQAAGVALAFAVGLAPAVAAAGTVGATWLYNGLLKGTALGPLSMGLCRYGNAALGLAVAGLWPTEAWVYLVPLGTLAYVAAVTAVARHEVAGATRARVLPPTLALFGLSAAPVAWGAAGLLPVTWAAALVVVPWLWLRGPAARALRDLTPGAVRGLVMAGIFGIAMINGVLAAMAGGFVAAALAVGLLVPGRAFGRWFYST